MPSTVIRSFQYDAEQSELVIVFQTNRTYTYLAVPSETYTAMKASFAKGEFFNEHIRGKFSFRRNADMNQGARYPGGRGE